MKKQIFILMIFTLALFANVNKSYAQIAPQTVTCLTTADALHPIAGTPYDYTITIPKPAAWTATENWTELHYQWFVTQDGTFFDETNGFTPNSETDGAFFNVATGTGISLYDIVNPTAGTTPTIKITWHGAGHDPDEPIFVGILVTGTIDGVTIDCSPHNLKVFRIEPQFSFTLDIDNLLATGANDSRTEYGDNIDICAPSIVSAIYDETNEEIDYDFGENTLYYEVTAANWFDKWMLSVQLGALGTGQTAQIDWAYAPSDRTAAIDYTAISTWNEVAPVSSAGSTTYTSTTPVSIQATLATSVGTAGENIIIRVILDNGTEYEGLDDLPVIIAVDGVLAHDNGSGVWVAADPATEGDIHHLANTTPIPEVCPWYDLFENDIATQTIKARPTIEEMGLMDPPTDQNDYLPIGTP